MFNITKYNKCSLNMVIPLACQINKKIFKVITASQDQGNGFPPYSCEYKLAQSWQDSLAYWV